MMDARRTGSRDAMQFLASLEEPPAGETAKHAEAKLMTDICPRVREIQVLSAPFSGHCCRVGMSQDLTAAGLISPASSGRAVNVSTTPERYPERLLAVRGAVRSITSGG